MKHFFTFYFFVIFTFFALVSVSGKDSSLKTNISCFENVTNQNVDMSFMSLISSNDRLNSGSWNNSSSVVKFKDSEPETSNAFTSRINVHTDLIPDSGVQAILPTPTNLHGEYPIKLIHFADSTDNKTYLNSPIARSASALPDVTLYSTEYIGTINGSPGFKYCNSSTDILFTNGSTSAATNTGYVINWGDGSSDFSVASWSSITHHYAFGLWTLTYTITDVSGNTLTKKYKILVSSYANVSFGSDNSSKDVCVGSDYSFLISNTESNPVGTIYTLTYNDGTPPIVYTSNPPAKVTHTFNTTSCGSVSTTSIGTYINSFSATIVASSPCGTNAVTLAPIYVSTPPKAIVNLLSNKVCVNAPTTITDNSTGYEITSADPSCKAPKRVWKITPSLGVTLSGGLYGNDFGNNSPTTWTPGSATISPVFSIPGTYTIKLIAGNFCGTDETEAIIVVEPALTPQFSIANEGCTPFSVTAVNTTDFSNNATVTYLWEVAYSAGNCGTAPGVWNFTNNTDKNSLNPSFNFNTPGIYTLKLSLFNSCGVVSTTQTLQVTKPPTVSINNIANSCDVAVIHPVAIVDACAPVTTAITYLWSFPGGTPGTSSSFTPGAINYSASGTYIVSLKVTNPDCGSSTTATKSFTVNITPIVDQPANQEVCKGIKTTDIVFSGNIANITYSWSNNNTAIGLSASGNGNILSFQTANATTSAITATIIVTPSINGCIGVTKTFTIRVNPIPTITPISNVAFCNGQISPDIILSGNVAGSTYSWTNNTPSIGLASSGIGNVPTFITSNNGITPVIATIQVIPAANGCNGTPRVFTITVYPTSQVTPIPNDTLCNNQNFKSIILTGKVAGAIFTWTNDMPSIGLPASGNGNIPSFIAVNSGVVPVNATIVVTPSANGCKGIPLTFSITVNPVVIVNDVADRIVCNNSLISATHFTGNSINVTYAWINSNTSIGLAASGKGDISQFVAQNTGSVSIIDTITVTPTAYGCSGIPKMFTITVIPVSKVTPIVNVDLCYHQKSNIMNVTGNVAGSTYTWTNDNSSIGLAASGTGDIPSFTAENTANTPQLANITVATKAFGCVGIPYTFSITVHPIIIVNDVAGQIICDSSMTSDINFSGNRLDAVYNWTNSNPAIGLPASGTGNIPQFITYNSGYASLLDTITVTPTANGCNGTPKIIIIKVNPTSKVTPIDNVNLCYQQTSDSIVLKGNVVGSIYTWTNDTPSIGLAAFGTGNIPSFIPENAGTSPLKATITVTPTASGCSESPYVFTMTVNPLVTVNDIASQKVCYNSQTSAINFSGNRSDATYYWTNTNTEIGVPSQGTGNITEYTAMNKGVATLTSTITVIPQANGCNGLPKSFTLTFYPLPEVNPVSDRNNCNNELNDSIHLTGKVAGTTFTWTNNMPSIGLASSGAGDIPGYTSANTGNAPVKATITIIPTANGCAGTPFSFGISVQPVPSIMTQDITMCSGGVFTSSPVNDSGNKVPLNTRYTWSKPVVIPLGSVTGSSLQTIPTDTISQKLTNLIQQKATVTYIVTPLSGTCPGKPFTIVVTVNPTSVILFSIPNQIIASGKTSQLITFPAITNGTVKYSWTIDVPTGISGQIMPDSNRINPQTLVNTTSLPLTVTYTVTSSFVDGSSCNGTTSIYSITVLPTIITSSITSGFNGFNISVTDGTDGWIDVTVTGGSGTYTYSWTGPNGYTSSTQDITGLTAGDYTLTVSDGYSDPVVLVFKMTDPLLLVIKEDLASHVNVACNSDSTGIIKIDIIQSSVGPYDYSIENQSGIVVAQAKDTITAHYLFLGLPAGTYQVKVTDANGHFKLIAGIVITEPVVLSASVSSVNAGCFATNTGSATLSAKGGSGLYTYSWNTIPVQTAATASGLFAGIYTGTVTDSNGCSKSISVTISEPSEIQIITDRKKDNSCFGALDGEILITVTGGTPILDFTWTKDGIPFSKSEDISNLNIGVYAVTVTDMNGCGPKTATFTITEPPAIGIRLISKNNITCFGDSTGIIQIEVTGGIPLERTLGVFEYTYSWSGPNGFISTSKDINDLIAGTYHLTVTDSTGCFKELQVTLTQHEKIVLSLETKQISCYDSNDASIKINTSGGVKPYQFKWSNMGSGTVQNNLSPGDYSVSVTDSVGCQMVASVTISQAKFFILPVITPVTCFGAHDGSISLNVVGGVQPVKLVWEDNSTDGNVRNNLGPGSYTALLSDAASCSFKQTFIVQEPLKMELNANITNAFDCNVQNSGAISLLVTGGTSPYKFEWSNNATTKNISNVPAGDYIVTVTDSNDCKITGQYQVQRQVPIKISVTSKSDYNCFTKIIKEVSTAVITGGVPPFQVVWSSGTVSGTNNEIMETTQSGMVTLQVSDRSGCTAFNSFNVEIQNPGIKYQMLDCNIFAFQFNAVVPNENESYTYSWDFGDGNISTLQNVQHVFNSSGNFTVELILKSQSCTSYYKQIINVESKPVLTINKIPTFCNGDSLILHVSGAKTYLWSDNSQNDSIVIKHAGNYTVIGTSNTGCVSSLAFTASNYEFNEYTIQTDRNEVANDKEPLHLWSENIVTSQYYWDFGDGKTDQGSDLTHIFDITTDGYYDVKLKIINAHGCVQEVTKRIWITQNVMPNTFTPNGDGKNDVFMKDWHIQVYNRNGILLYEGRDGWDGTHKGVPVTNDTYFYVVYYSAESGSKTNTGFVTVLR